MLWLSLHCPHLPLEIFPSTSASPEPLAVSEGRGTRRRLLACNGAAKAAGLAPGIAVSAAVALAPGVRIRERDAAMEAAALSRLALWAGQFSPTVSLVPQRGLLLEVEGCLSLFGGLERLAEKVGTGMEELGYRFILAAAPTPLGAWLLARAGKTCLLADPEELRGELAPLPLELLELPASTLATLHGVGVHTLGGCLELPRAGLARRFGPELAEGLDRALGRLPDPRLPFVPPSRFEAGIELPAEVQEGEALLFAARRLLLELEGFLTGRGGGVQRIRLKLAHVGRPATAVTLGLAAPGRAAGHWLGLLRERLGRLELPAPARAMTLSAAEVLPLAGRNLSLFGDTRQEAEERAALVERLQARLGGAAVRGIRAVAEHRPELAWRYCAPGEGAPTPSFAPRPLWLLAEPRPLPAPDGTHGPALTLESGPERIETGWWDGQAVERDYFVARDEAGARLWIFRERGPEGRWYLHGYFA